MFPFCDGLEHQDEESCLLFTFAVPMHLDLFVDFCAIEIFQPEEWRM